MKMREETAEMDELSAFLSHAALEAGETQGDPYEDCVQLMTLHCVVNKIERLPEINKGEGHRSFPPFEVPEGEVEEADRRNKG